MIKYETLIVLASFFVLITIYFIFDINPIVLISIAVAIDLLLLYFKKHHKNKK